MTTDDIVAIEQLEAFCHHAVDHADQSLLPQVFTPDARFDGRCAADRCARGSTRSSRSSRLASRRTRPRTT